MKRICVFCGSKSGLNPVYSEAAQRVGTSLARRGLGLVFGGGRVGLMGAAADAALAAGGEVIGVIPESMTDEEIAHPGLTELRVVRSMHERKAIMADLADAFLALPGGYGTFEEFCEILTWAQLGLHGKACGLLNVEGYYDPLLGLFDHAVAEGFLSPSNRALVLEDTDPERMLERLLSFHPSAMPKKIEQDER